MKQVKFGLLMLIVLTSAFNAIAQQSVFQPGDYRDGIYEKENSTKQIHSNKFVPIKNREGNAETTTGKTGCLDKYNTAYPVTNNKYLYYFSRKESGRFEHPDNYFYFCGVLKRIILKSNNKLVW